MISLYLIHGWGVNAHIFKDFITRLPENWSIHAIDLPGHGTQKLKGDFSLIQAADDIAKTMTQNSFVLGWSMGSQVAQQLAARHPEKVRGMVLMSGFAKLRASEDYPEGINNSLLNKMLHLFQEDYAHHVQQFLALQLLNTPERQFIIQHILPDIIQHGTPSALHSALNALESADTRALLPEINTPALIICGNKDAVTPPRMSQYLAQYLPRAQCIFIDKAAHAPFLSHADLCAQHITPFINNIEQNQTLFQAA